MASPPADLKLTRFTASVRASGGVGGTSLSLSDLEDAILKKRARKKSHDERTVADLINLISADISKSKKQTVCVSIGSDT